MKKNILNLHLEVLPPDGLKIFNKLSSLGGVLGGGTALALLIRHRYSYDFDLFFNKPISTAFKVKVKNTYKNCKLNVIVDSSDELSLTLDGQKLSFIYFPFKPLHQVYKKDSLQIFHLNDLAANKAYTIGRRATWRDYVDLFFLLKDWLSLSQIINEAKQKFNGLFSEKLFLEQLVFFDDLHDFSVEFFGGAYSEKEIKDFLVSQVRDYLK